MWLAFPIKKYRWARGIAQWSTHLPRPRPLGLIHSTTKLRKVSRPSIWTWPDQKMTNSIRSWTFKQAYNISLCNYPFVKWEKRARHGGIYLYPKKVDKIGSSRSPPATCQVWGQFVGYMKPHFKIPKLKTIWRKKPVNPDMVIKKSALAKPPSNHIYIYLWRSATQISRTTLTDCSNPSKYKLSICRTRTGNYVMGILLHSESWINATGFYVTKPNEMPFDPYVLPFNNMTRIDQSFLLETPTFLKSLVLLLFTEFFLLLY